MILLVAIIVGLFTGLTIALLQKRTWQPPPLRITWLVVVALLPQIFSFYFPATRSSIPDNVAAVGLVLSQALLLAFCWYNRQLSGVWLLALGLALNLLVITSNGGFMPISPQTASRLVPETVLAKLQIGNRFGLGKDILLLPENTRLVWLSDHFLPPKWLSYQVAFSLGDILIAVGAFWLTLTQGRPVKLAKNR